jgi:hypothetical protein
MRIDLVLVRPVSTGDGTGPSRLIWGIGSIPMDFLCRRASSRLDFLRRADLLSPAKEAVMPDAVFEMGLVLALHLSFALAITLSLRGLPPLV